MHSMHVTVALHGDLADGSALSGELEEVVSFVSAKTGFVHGYWLAPRNGEGHSYIFFDTEENARAGAPPVGHEHSGGRAVISNVDIWPVAASA